MTVTAGEYYRVNEPDWNKTFGQSSPPGAYVHVQDGVRTELAWGEEFQASDQTTNLADYAPGKVHTSILQILADNDQLTKTS